MNLKILSAVAVIALFLIGIFVFYWLPTQKETGDANPKTSTEATLAPEVEQVLIKETGYLEELIRDPAILSAVIASNKKDASLSKEDIARIDDEWQKSKGVTPFIQQFLSNSTAERLLTFQKVHPGFKEVFVANAYGLNVGQTNKTSDYLQSDEAWWQNSYNDGVGKVSHGKIEFDESSQTEAISLYVPIIDPSSSKAVGVLKAVLDLSSIKSAL